MQDINFLIWAFPIFFIFHDFEEIIFIKPWFDKNKAELKGKYPVIGVRIIPHVKKITTASFALGVWEEFLIITVLTVITYQYRTYTAWLGAFLVFTIHLIIHCVQAILMRCYVPFVATSVILIPFCFFIIQGVFKLHPINFIMLICAVLVSTVIMIGNLLMLHKGMELFSKWEKNS